MGINALELKKETTSDSNDAAYAQIYPSPTLFHQPRTVYISVLTQRSILGTSKMPSISIVFLLSTVIGLTIDSGQCIHCFKLFMELLSYIELGGSQNQAQFIKGEMILMPIMRGYLYRMFPTHTGR